MQSFNIGDRVIGCGVQSDVDITGMTGTIVENKMSSTYDWAVDFDEEGRDLPAGSLDTTVSFHDCSGEARWHHGWYCNDENIAPLAEERWDGEVSDLVSLL